MQSPIKLDRSSTGVVIVCAECPWWSAFRFTQEDAWAVAIRHEEDHHPERFEQRNAARQRDYMARVALATRR